MILNHMLKWSEETGGEFTRTDKQVSTREEQKVDVETNCMI